MSKKDKTMKIKTSVHNIENLRVEQHHIGHKLEAISSALE